jgi:hypothetical protein
MQLRYRLMDCPVSFLEEGLLEMNDNEACEHKVLEFQSEDRRLPVTEALSLAS